MRLQKRHCKLARSETKLVAARRLLFLVYKRGLL